MFGDYQEKAVFPSRSLQFPILKDMNLKPDVFLPQPPAKPVTELLCLLCLFDFSVFHLYSIKCFELLIPRVEVPRKYGIKVVGKNFQAYV